MFRQLAFASLFIASLAGAYCCGRNSVQDANALVSAGFTIVDPEGYIVDRFDGPFTFPALDDPSYVPARTYAEGGR